MLILKRRKPKILIAGAGPAGASLACRLSREGFPVVLIEREKFPRHKLCGEFISPECLEHFRELNVLDEMISAGGERISETVFYSISGRAVGVPSAWLGDKRQNALSLSRAEMDLRLLEKAKEYGSEVTEAATIGKIHIQGAKVRAVSIKNENGVQTEIEADLFIDATGRSGILNKLAERETCKGKPKTRSKSQAPILVGFKTHLENADIGPGVCEIYFFRGGYGGLSRVENGAANLCFLIRAETVKKFGGDANDIVRNVIFENNRARATLTRSVILRDWLAVSIDSFGMKKNMSAGNLVSVGDARAFIDPFTGSGMLMALESSRLLTEIIVSDNNTISDISAVYRARYARKFRKRLAVCAAMRRLAFFPKLAGAGISLLSCFEAPRQILARATRSI